MVIRTNREYEFIKNFQKLKLKTAKVIALTSRTEDQSFISDELLSIPDMDLLVCPPGVLLYYLRFISYHRLNDISRRQDCLHDLMLYVTTESPKFSLALQFYSLTYLRKAFIIISDTEGVYSCDIMIRTLIDSTDLKKLFDQE